MTHNIGDLVYVRINEGRGITLARLLSRHDPEHSDVDLHPDTGAERIVMISDEDILDYDPYAEPEEEWIE